jgi:hypothetical protein
MSATRAQVAVSRDHAEAPPSLEMVNHADVHAFHRVGTRRCADSHAGGVEGDQRSADGGVNANRSVRIPDT